MMLNMFNFCSFVCKIHCLKTAYWWAFQSYSSGKTINAEAYNCYWFYWKQCFGL